MKKELKVEYGHQKSYYKKAFLNEENGKIILKSYDSKMIVKENNKLIFNDNINLYSLTTLRHVKEWLKQLGKFELANLPKQKLIKLLASNNFIINL